MLQSGNGPAKTVDPAPALRVIHQPTVDRVDRQLVDQAEVARLLTDHGVAWPTDTAFGRCGTSFALRPSRSAAVEVRKRALQVLTVRPTEAAHLFGESPLVPLSDGTFEATTPHRKV
jgi:hypothetical protein